MLIRKLKYIAHCLIVILTITSCVEDVDFEQAENLTLTPVVASSVVYTDVAASRFSENGTELQVVRDSIANIEIFTEQFVIDNLVRTELIFEATNTINRTFGLQIDFLDDSDTLLYTLAFDAQPSLDGNEVITETTHVFEGDNQEALKMTVKMVITLTLYPSDDGSMLNESSQGSIVLKSKGLFYLNVSV